jgi:hypothetical protein
MHLVRNNEVDVQLLLGSAAAELVDAGRLKAWLTVPGPGEGQQGCKPAS